MTAIHEKKRASPWLIGLRSDTFLILLAGPVISLALLWGVWHGPAFLIGAALFALLLDIPHLLHTYVAMLSDPVEFIGHQRPFWISLIIISVGCTGMMLAGQFLWLVTIWVYWQPYHVCKQHFGVATMYARKSGYVSDTGHIKALALAGFLAPLMYRLTHGGFEFGHYVLFGQPLPFSGLRVYAPTLPALAAGVAYMLFGLAIVYFLQVEWRRRQQGESLPRFVWIMLVVSLALYNAAYLLIGDLYALILIGTSIHAIQYHLVCVSIVRQRVSSIQSAQSVKPGHSCSVKTSPCSDRRHPILFCMHRYARRMQGDWRYWAGTLFLASSLVMATEFPSLGIVPLILVLHHFYLDGVIWKRKKS